MKKLLGVLGFIVLLLFTGIILVFLKTYVIMDMGVLWDITQITELGFNRVLGIMLIINFFKMKYPKMDGKDKEKDMSDISLDYLGKFIAFIMMILAGWGISYLVHSFI